MKIPTERGQWVEYDILTDSTKPAPKRVRLQSDSGWFIEVEAADDGLGVVVRCAGNIRGSGSMRVEPLSPNQVHIFSESVEGQRELDWEEQARKCDEANAEFRKKHKRNL